MEPVNVSANNKNLSEAMPGKRLLNVLAGKMQTPPPIWLMRQAGRYLPEYRKIRSQTAGFLELCYDPALACEITLQPVQRFALDAAIIFSDILVVPHALGQEVWFVEGEGPKLSPLKSESDLRNFDISRITGHLSPVYEALALVKKELPSNTALIGFSGAPWTVATYMIEGGTSREFINTRRWAYETPIQFGRLIEMLVDATSIHLCNQIAAGAEVVQIFDSWAGILTADGFNRWVIEPTAAIVRRVREQYKNIPIIGFPRGAGRGYLEYAEKTGVSAISFDSSISLDWAARKLQPTVPVQGNLDSVLLLAGGEPMRTAAENILQQLGNGPLIFNLGHGVIKETPPDHVEELVQLVRAQPAQSRS
jgi:uroporphyrinogen decarboxylase